jgi:exopolysaccharide biosynthesis predicted pyruvyltransferase EpsI
MGKLKRTKKLPFPWIREESGAIWKLCQRTKSSAKPKEVSSGYILKKELSNIRVKLHMDKLGHKKAPLVHPFLPESDLMISRLRQYQHALGGYLRTNGPLFLLAEMPGNVGDHLIWLGTERLLELENLQYTKISVTEVRTKIRRHPWNGTLVVPGSGALNALFSEWLPATIELASKLFERIVILPSEYEPHVQPVHDALSCSNVFAYAREVESYGKIKAYGRAALSLDPALWAFEFRNETRPGSGDHDPGKVLVALRTDSASVLEQRKLEPSPKNDDISLSKPNLSEFLASITESDTVVSDRLHVVVAATMLGKSVRFIDPYNEKISRYVRYNLEDEFNYRLQPRDEHWLLEAGYADFLGGHQ